MSGQFEDRLTAGPAWDALGLTRSDRTRDLLDGLLTRDRIHAIAPPPYPGDPA